MGRERSSGAGELPSVSLTMKFLALCRQYGAERLAVRIVAAGRSTGVAGLPESDDWTAWDAGCTVISQRRLLGGRAAARGAT